MTRCYNNKSDLLENNKSILCSYGCGNYALFYSSRTKKYRCAKSSNSCPAKKKKLSRSLTEIKTVDTNNLCFWGCGNIAYYQFKNGKYCCQRIHSLCPNVIQSNSTKKKENPYKCYEIHTLKLCDYGCGKTAKFKYNNGKKLCSNTPNGCPSKIQKTKNIFLERYGVDNYFKLRDKIKFNFLEKYGVDHPMKVKKFVRKASFNSQQSPRNKKQNEWLSFMGLPDCKEYRCISLNVNDGIKSGILKVDGYDSKTNTVYEFWGDYWHGNNDIYESNFMNKRIGKTMGTLFEETMQKRMRILNAGYNLVEIWENDWEKYKNV